MGLTSSITKTRSFFLPLSLFDPKPSLLVFKASTATLAFPTTSITMNQAEATPAPPRSKATRMLSFLSKNVKSVSFQNHPFSPGRHHCHVKTFSGPILIPPKSKSGRRFDADQEPTSPKISCMGQIKHKKKSKTVVVPRPPSTSTTATTLQDKAKKKKKPKAKSTTAFKPARNSDVNSEGGDDGDRDSAPPPGLGQMKKFASSRDSKLAQFEWKDYSSDEDEVLVPHSAPMLVGGGKNEVNLWKRRTMDPPKPLQLNKMRVK